MQNQYKTLEEKWENATLANSFIFSKVMRNHPDACKRLVEMLLNIQIDRMEMITEAEINPDPYARGIRLDVYLKDSSRVIDVEMQVRDTKNLPERSRYYQSVLDTDTLQRSQNYNQLKDNHIIFLCMSDIFNQGLPVYTFQNLCLENNGIPLNDRTWKHFFIVRNCAKMLEDKELKAFFELIISNHPNTQFTGELKEYISSAKYNAKWRMEYMIWENNLAQAEQDARDRGWAEGKKEGIKEGRLEGKKEGIKEGRLEKSLEDAVIAIKQLGISLEKASECFGVPLQKIQAALQ